MTYGDVLPGSSETCAAMGLSVVWADSMLCGLSCMQVVLLSSW